MLAGISSGPARAVLSSIPAPPSSSHAHVCGLHIDLKKDAYALHW
jgi:hypothetical protein